MSDHYYTERPEIPSKPKTWKFRLKGHEFTFTSDAGVFSKHEVDFGSRLLIEAFQPVDVKGDYCDVGCGYGPIGMALAKAEPDRHVIMVDINERALDLAKKNLDANGIANTSVKKSNLLHDVNEEGFAAIITNPPIRAGKKIVHQIFEQAEEKLADGGELWVVIQKKQGAPSATEKLKELFRQVDVVEKKKGYYIIRAKKIDVV